MNPSAVPTVGVALANYNKANFLNECLDSVFRQTYPKLEVVVVDDCSDDASWSILKEYASRHANLRVIRNDSTEGVAGARNKALSALDVEWVTTLDSDDFYCHQDKLQLEMKTIQASAKSVIAFSGFRFVDSKGNATNQCHPKPIMQGWLFEQILARSCFIPRDFIFQRALFDEVGRFDTTLPIYEDWDLKIRLARKQEFVYTGIEAIAYRQNTGGLSSANGPTHRKWLSAVFNRYVGDTNDPDGIRAEFEKNISGPFHWRLYYGFKSWLSQRKRS